MPIIATYFTARSVCLVRCHGTCYQKWRNQRQKQHLLHNEVCISLSVSENIYAALWIKFINTATVIALWIKRKNTSMFNTLFLQIR